MVTDNKDGTYSVTPDSNYNGPLKLSWTVSDGKGGSTPASTSLNVSPVNDAPVGADNVVWVAKNGNRAFTSGDFGFSDTADSGAMAAAKRVQIAPALATDNCWPTMTRASRSTFRW